MNRRQFVSLALLATTAMLLTGCFKASPGKTVENFHRYMSEGKIDEAMKLFPSSFTQSLGKEGQEKLKLALSEVVRQVGEKGGVKSFKVEKEKTVGQTADVTYTIEYGNGTKETNTAKLIQENGDWKISPGK